MTTYTVTEVHDAEVPARDFCTLNWATDAPAIGASAAVAQCLDAIERDEDARAKGIKDTMLPTRVVRIVVEVTY